MAAAPTLARPVPLAPAGGSPPANSPRPASASRLGLVGDEGGLQMWSVERTASWVEALPLTRSYRGLFRDACVSGRVLKDLADEDLAAMGVSSALDRHSILAAVPRALSRKSSGVAVPSPELVTKLSASSFAFNAAALLTQEADGSSEPQPPVESPALRKKVSFTGASLAESSEMSPAQLDRAWRAFMRDSISDEQLDALAGIGATDGYGAPLRTVALPEALFAKFPLATREAMARFHIIEAASVASPPRVAADAPPASAFTRRPSTAGARPIGAASLAGSTSPFGAAAVAAAPGASPQAAAGGSPSRSEAFLSQPQIRLGRTRSFFQEKPLSNKPDPQEPASPDPLCEKALDGPREQQHLRDITARPLLKTMSAAATGGRSAFQELFADSLDVAVASHSDSSLVQGAKSPSTSSPATHRARLPYHVLPALSHEHHALRGAASEGPASASASSESAGASDSKDTGDRSAATRPLRSAGMAGSAAVRTAAEGKSGEAFSLPSI